ncbi:type II toxin-antitoxin system RelE/ParE family toxin [Fructobacillus ficulneus]|uniref:Addiction module toxin RelE/StbE family n=1 Tax=Fructobacillus ficulneus TaxID=157463 RepID=A0A0K8MI93_9LACO|nr:type II toxin-antitoxin system RelE/ParE family toxin [Fructobacillus ficulneus]GAP00287.1 addiction module toxin RelE/StbE family [Fructobacillus ficulneus]
MMFTVKISEQAKADIQGIYEYIAFELNAPKNAARQLDRLEGAIQKLNTFPDSHQLYSNEPWRSRGLRFLPVNNYLVYFIVNTDSAMVWVIRVMYGGRNIEYQLNQKSKF